MSEQNNNENSKLLSLIEHWTKSIEGLGKAYENVVLELLNGDSYLFLENLNTKNIKDGFSIADKNKILSFNIYTKDGKNYLTAFTNIDLLSKWVKKQSRYVKLDSKTLMKMTEQIDVDGIIINTGSENMFPLFINKQQN